MTITPTNLDSGDVAEVFALPGVELPDAALALRERTSDQRMCKHDWRPQVELDPEARVVTCRKCGDAVDAFTVLLAWTREFAHLRRDWTSASAATAKAQERLERVLHAEKLAKARLRRAEDRTDVAVLIHDLAVERARLYDADRFTRRQLGASWAESIRDLDERLRRAIDRATRESS